MSVVSLIIPSRIMGVRNQCLKIRFAMGLGRSLPLSISSSVDVDSLLIWDSLVRPQGKLPFLLQNMYGLLILDYVTWITGVEIQQ